MKKLLTLILALTLVFTVAGCGGDDDPVGPTDATLVTEATTALLLTDLNEVTDDLDLPTGGLHSSVITWASSDDTVITSAGAVTRPAVGVDNAVITMTATITIGDESATKEFDVRVIAAVPTLDVTIAELNAHTYDATEDEYIEDIAVGTDLVVTGVVFDIVEGAGFQISDGTGFTYIYAGTSEGVALGDNVKVTGQKVIYYGLPEVGSVSSTEVLSSGNTLPAYEVTSIVDLFDEDGYDTIYWSKPITITGLVSVSSGGDAILTATDTEGATYDVVVYYKSFPAQITALVALEGQIATADVIIYGYHDGLGAWRVTVAEGASITAVVATDAEILASEVGQLDLGVLTEVLDNLTLPTVGANDGTTISWASDNEAVVSTAGVVNRVIGSDTTVVLTATITVGDETDTKVFTATVKDADYAVATITVAEAIATDAEVITSSGSVGTGADVVVQGIVTAIIGSSKIVLQDAAGGPGITTYTSDFNDDNTFALGDEVIIRGTHVVYFGLQELTDLVLVSVVSSGNTVQLSTTTTAANIIDNFVAAPYALQGLNATLTNLQVISVDYAAKSGNIVVAPTDDLTSLLIFSAYDISYSDSLEVGDILTEVTVVIWDYYYSASRVIITAYPDLTEAEQLDAAAAVLDIPTATVDNIVLPLLDADYAGLTIVWASTNETVISTLGVVTQPLEGASDVTVTLTATLSLGTATDKVVTFDVLVAAVTPPEPDLFFSEVVEGSSYNKALEIYNPTDATIDLSLYTILENHGSYTNTTVLSGTLAAGEVYVLCHASATTDIMNNCDISTEDVPNFNGNDTLQLVKGGVVIDQFFAETLAGGSDFAKDITYVRNPDVNIGVTVFDANEWTTYAVDEFSYLGSHTVNP